MSVSDLAEAGKKYRVLELVLAGAAASEIALELGTTDKIVRNVIKAEFETIRQEALEFAKLYREIVLLRLDRLLTSVWTKALKGEHEDWDRALKVIVLQAKIMGAFAPTRVDSRAINVVTAIGLSKEERERARMILDVPPELPALDSAMQQREVQKELAAKVDRVKFIDNEVEREVDG